MVLKGLKSLECVFSHYKSCKTVGKIFTIPVCSFHRGSMESSNSQAEQVSDTNNLYVRKGVPLSLAEYSERKKLKPSQPLDPHILKVAMLGEPNVGKSTLTNRLVKWAVCSVSKKVHTTRKKSSAILVEDNKQVVFLDTPGFITPEKSIEHKLEVSLVADPAESVRECDLIAVITDASCKWTNKRIHEEILALLNENRDKKSILVLNKVDALKPKGEALTISRILSRGAIEGRLIDDAAKCKFLKAFRRNEKYQQRKEGVECVAVAPDDQVLDKPLEHYDTAKGWPFFSKIFMLSALTGNGVDDLRDYMLGLAMPGDWLYHESNIIDKSPHDIALMTVRGVLLDHLPQEVPYNLNLRIKKWEVDDIDCLKIHIIIGCGKPRYKHLLIGKSGARIANCVERARQALQDTFRCEICLRIGIE